MILVNAVMKAGELYKVGRFDSIAAADRELEACKAHGSFLAITGWGTATRSREIPLDEVECFDLVGASFITERRPCDYPGGID